MTTSCPCCQAEVPVKIEKHEVGTSQLGGQANVNTIKTGSFVYLGLRAQRLHRSFSAHNKKKSGSELTRSFYLKDKTVATVNNDLGCPTENPDIESVNARRPRSALCVRRRSRHL